MGILIWILSCGEHQMAAGARLGVQTAHSLCCPSSGLWEFSGDRGPDCLHVVSPHHTASPRMIVIPIGALSQQTEPTGSCQSLQAWTDTASLPLHPITELSRFQERRHRRPCFQWEECKRSFWSPIQGFLDSLPIPATAVPTIPHRHNPAAPHCEPLSPCPGHFWLYFVKKPRELTQQSQCPSWMCRRVNTR